MTAASTARYVIAELTPPRGFVPLAEKGRTWTVETMLDLPDAEHIHLTRLPDGGWTAVAMEEQTFPSPTWKAIARLFHRNYEDLAPDFGYVTRPESALPWEQVPERNRALMIATVGQVLRDLRDTGSLWVDVEEAGA